MFTTTRIYHSTVEDIVACGWCGELCLPLKRHDPLCSWCWYVFQHSEYPLPARKVDSHANR